MEGIGIVPIAVKNYGLVTSVIAFDANTGNRITDIKIIFQKKLWGLFDSIRYLSNLIDAKKQNFILGFSWKTDSFVPLNHPAYAMWSDLRDRRKEFAILPFSVSEIRSAINVFGNQLGDTINPVLRNYLVN